MELWRTVPDGAREMVPEGRCPRCASTRVHRSRTRGPFELLLRSVSPWRVFKCSACRWRGWRIPRPSEGPAVEGPDEPPRPKRNPVDRHGRRMLSVNEQRARRRRLQFVVAVILALVAGGVYIANQATLSFEESAAR